MLIPRLSIRNTERHTHHSIKSKIGNLEDRPFKIVEITCMVYPLAGKTYPARKKHSCAHMMKPGKINPDLRTLNRIRIRISPIYSLVFVCRIFPLNNKYSKLKISRLIQWDIGDIGIKSRNPISQTLHRN